MPARPLGALPLVASLLAACAPAAPIAASIPVEPVPSAAPTAPIAMPADPRAAEMGRLHVLMINGGGKPEINYQTHLLHLKELRELLLGAGVSPDRMTILSGDGPDPAPDLASRAPTSLPDLYLLRGTKQEEALAGPTVFRNSEIAGASLGVASKQSLATYFERAATAIKPGETLLLYVTDHGRPKGKGANLQSNTIVLWKNELLTAPELGDLLDRLDPGVRVIGFMSQCFSGGFAGLATRGEGRPRAPFCGYFSTIATRQAYGCYPEDNSRERPGHSFQMFHALAATRSLAEAHLATLLRDVTPDAPLRTSDLYLDGLVRRHAQERGVPYEALVDELLAAGPAGDASWQRERALADRIGETFGVPARRSFADLAEHRKDLPVLSHELDEAARKLRGEWMAYAKANTTGFLARHPDWGRRLGDAALPSLDPEAARALATPFLRDLVADTRPEMRDRLHGYRARINALTAGSYRADIRAGASVRVRVLLAALAGRAFLASPSRGATAADRAGWEAVRACEDLRLPGATTELDAPPPPLPPLADDEALRSAK